MRILAILGLVIMAGCSSSSTSEVRTGTTGGETATQPMPEQTSTDSGGDAAAESNEITCANVRCMAGTHCEMVQVQCIRAPCPPMPQCVAD